MLNLSIIIVTRIVCMKLIVLIIHETQTMEAPTRLMFVLVGHDRADRRLWVEVDRFCVIMIFAGPLEDRRLLSVR